MPEAEKVFIGGEHEVLVKDEIITEKEHDPGLVKEIIKYGGKDVQTCLQCGNCTSVCPVSLKTEYKTRNIIKLCQYGLKKDVLGTKWICATCYRCYEHCPADLNPAEIMIALRHICIREGIIPEFIKRTSRNVLKYGQTVEISKDVEILREELNLPKIASSLPEYKKTVNEIKTIIQEIGYDKLIQIREEE